MTNDTTPREVGSHEGLGAGAGARHPWDAEILSLLSADFGTTTGDLAQRHSALSRWAGNRRMQSAAALAVLRRLEADGLVRKMDDQKPIAWMLVAPNVRAKLPDAAQLAWTEQTTTPAAAGQLERGVRPHALTVESNMVEVKSGLSESCDAVLAQWDMYARPKDDGISAEVYDCDGEYQTTVRRHIDPSDLLALLRYGRHRFNEGNKQGAESVRAGLRAMLGAAPLEPLN